METLRQSIVPSAAWSNSFKQYMGTPLPNIHQPLGKLELVALDMETTGLDFETDKILSIGSVNLTCDQVDFSSSHEMYVNHGQYIQAHSATINQITPKLLSKAKSIDTAMDELLEKIRGKVILAHHAVIERKFIEAYVRQKYGLRVLPCYFIDTLCIEKQFSYANRYKEHTSYYLGDLRRHYNLPDYHSHSAATDAASCAELFLVQTKKLKLFNLASSTDLVSHDHN